MCWDEQPTIIGTGFASTLTQTPPQKNRKKPRQIGFRMPEPARKPKR
jgi:hypothetical protein